MFIDTAESERPALQRSAMFPAMNSEMPAFRSFGARICCGAVCSINITSLRDDKAWFKNLAGKNKVLETCYTESHREIAQRRR